MTLPPSSLAVTAILVATLFFLPLHTVVNGLGSDSTIAVNYGTGTVCGIIAGEHTQRIKCYRNGQIVSIQPNVSYKSISGGKNFFCGLRSNGFSVFCWDTSSMNSTFEQRRIYYSKSVPLTDLAVGSDQVCAREMDSGLVRCWRGEYRGGSTFSFPELGEAFYQITCGHGFGCGILKNNSRVLCWGNEIGVEIQRLFGNLSMSSVVAGESHVCGVSKTGIMVCRGKNDSGQLNVPFASGFQFMGLALGANFSCSIRRINGLVECWGGGNTRIESGSNVIENVSFESIVAGLNFVCGLTTANLSMICWGPGWSNGLNVPLGMIIPGPCVDSLCSSCGIFPDSEILCDGSGNICKSCQIELPIAVPLPPITRAPSQSLSPQSEGRNKLSMAFVIVGSIGIFAGMCAIVYCSQIGICWFLHSRVYRSAQPTSTQANEDGYDTLPSRSSSVRRQRSGPLSKHTNMLEKFSLMELAAATNNFSLENKIGSGSFGIVYKGNLADGRKVAIKRGEISMTKKKIQENETAFDSELALLPRLHHKHLVGLIGFCEENDERLLVYEFMGNGALHEHLHGKNNIEKNSSILNSWKLRIKIALDAARGVEYLHNYAVPPIIHRDIKSSNILLDENWTARVSDFGLSLMGPESDQEFLSTKAVGTIGYIDPEYFVLNVLTAKSDVYGLGVVLLELLTGKRAVFKNEEDSPMGVVEYAGPEVSSGELWRVLDKRVGSPNRNEAEAVELVAQTAMHCVNLEGKERPFVTNIVTDLERALALCEDSHGSFSATEFFVHSE